MLTHIGCNDGSTTTSILTAGPKWFMIKTSGQHKLQDRTKMKDSLTEEQNIRGNDGLT
jgi:hypothetical protein